MVNQVSAEKETKANKENFGNFLVVKEVRKTFLKNIHGSGSIVLEDGSGI